MAKAAIEPSPVAAPSRPAPRRAASPERLPLVGAATWAGENPAERLLLGDSVSARLVPLFVFLHSPKTAGSSMRRVLATMFGPHHRFFSTYEELAPTPENQALWATSEFYNRYLLIGGHVWRRHPIVGPKHLARRIVYIALFRDPVRRAVSGYDFSRRFPGHPMRDFLADKTLLEAVRTPGPFRNRYVLDQLRYTFGTSDKDEAAAALRAGNYIVAPIERLEAFVDAVSAVSGLPRPERTPRVNTAEELPEPLVVPAREQADYADALALLEEDNAAEIAFMRDHLRDVVVTTSLTPL